MTSHCNKKRLWHFPHHPDHKRLRQSADGNYTMLFQASKGYSGTKLDEIARQFDKAIGSGKKNKRRRLNFLRAFVWSCMLCVAYEQAVQETEPDRTVWVSYSRDKNDYRCPNRYGNLHYTHLTATRIVDHALGLGWVDHVTGQYRGEQSRFRPIGDFRAALSNLKANEKTIKKVGTRNREVLILKGSKPNPKGKPTKYLMDYQDSTRIQ